MVATFGELLRTAVRYRHSPTYALFVTVKKGNSIFETSAEFFVAGVKAQWDEGGGGILLGDNTSGGVVMLRPIRLQWVGSLDLSWTALCVCVCVYIYIFFFSIFMIIFDILKIRIVPGRTECAYSVSLFYRKLLWTIIRISQNFF
jgi:hypothetical protein